MHKCIKCSSKSQEKLPASPCSNIVTGKIIRQSGTVQPLLLAKSPARHCSNIVTGKITPQSLFKHCYWQNYRQSLFKHCCWKNYRQLKVQTLYLSAKLPASRNFNYCAQKVKNFDPVEIFTQNLTGYYSPKLYFFLNSSTRLGSGRWFNIILSGSGLACEPLSLSSASSASSTSFAQNFFMHHKTIAMIRKINIGARSIARIGARTTQNSICVHVS